MSLEMICCSGLEGKVDGAKGSPSTGRPACWMCHSQVFVSPAEKIGFLSAQSFLLGHVYPLPIL